MPTYTNMKTIHTIRPLVALLMIALLSLAIMAGCNSRSTDNLTIDEYRVIAALVLDRNDDQQQATARLFVNESAEASATLSVAGFELPYVAVDSVYQAVISPFDTLAGRDAYLKWIVSSQYRDSALVAVVDTFSFTGDIDPQNHQLQGLLNVILSWTAAVNAERYVLAAVKAEDAYTGTGWAANVADIGLGGTIPPDAFIDPVSSEADTGLYNIYVYAISGSPDSALASAFLPVPLPEQRADNIDGRKLSGRAGSVSVTLKDTIRVVTAAR